VKQLSIYFHPSMQGPISAFMNAFRSRFFNLRAGLCPFIAPDFLVLPTAIYRFRRKAHTKLEMADTRAETAVIQVASI